MRSVTDKKKNWLGVGLLLLTALIWGFAFSAQAMADDAIGTFTIGCLRYLIAGIVLIPCILLFDRLRGDGRKLFYRKNGRFRIGIKRREWIGGVSCGVVMITASSLQQAGIAQGGDAGKAAFITALYVIFVPITGLFFKRFPRKLVALAAVIALCGFYLLNMKIEITEPGLGGFFHALGEGDFTFGSSELLLLLCAFGFTAHVVVIDRFADVDGIRLSCIQCFVAGVISLPLMLFAEKPTLSAIGSAMLPLLYIGIFSSAVAYTCQILGQKYVNVSVAPILMSLESVFGALGGVLLLGDEITPLRLIGCGAIFLAVILAQLPAKEKPKE